jgi:nitroreductase
VIPWVEGRTDRTPVVVQASQWGSIIPAAWSFMLAARARGLGTV